LNIHRICVVKNFFSKRRFFFLTKKYVLEMFLKIIFEQYNFVRSAERVRKKIFFLFDFIVISS